MQYLKLVGMPESGCYVVAVSGGVDSTVLLALLKQQRPQLRLVVAHVEHGIRGQDSRDDAAFVKMLARSLGLPFELLEAHLGESASEELARRRRYEFLERVGKKHHAAGIITAHHQDDVIETIYLNIVRGTGWRGLCSLRSTPQVVRPLLSYPKSELVEYAKAHRLRWRHDVTNDDDRYTRNRIRRHLATHLSPETRAKLLALWEHQCALRAEIEAEAQAAYRSALVFAHQDWVELNRYFLSMLPRSVAYEVLRSAVLQTGGHSLLHSQAERLLIFALTAKPGSQLAPGGGLHCRSTRRGLVVGKG